VRSRPVKTSIEPPAPAKASARCGAPGPNRTSRLRGFSLIELLVVMTVAMLLTALTLPAMRQVHENAQRVACMSNLQQLGHAFVMFGDDHDDLLPTSLVLMNKESPQHLMISRRVGASGSNWDGLGLLFALHYCDTPECFYCPSHRGNHPFERYASAWRSPTPGQSIFTNYHYAGHMDWKNASRRRTMLDGYRLVLATDGLRTASDFNHLVGMNSLRGDGSVRWRDDTENIYGVLPKSELESIGPQYMNLWDIVADPR
jgi:prepilin-type N-terminal cleavage/methylation domain-containing protein